MGIVGVIRSENIDLRWKWQYFSVNGDNVFSSGKHTGGRESDDLAVGAFDSPQQFMNSKYNMSGDKNNPGINSYGYTEGYVLPTTSEQDNTIRDTFINISKNENYDVIGNNCATAVLRSLEAAGIKTYNNARATYKVPDNHKLGESGYTASYSVTSRPFVPSSAFKSVIKYNPQGYMIK